ncbi:hypothetical protein [Lentibacillus salinarum]|uniref:Uncharacterized protein n=1 Tax=Lentibacillus salinarum TaxID=446820 RepID=A0ABW3ZQ88_9BACI
MNTEHTTTKREQPLRLVLPNLYQTITDILEKQHNIHPYDLQVKAIPESSGYTIIVYFGDSFNHQKYQTFSNEAIQSIDSEIVSFIEETGNACKEVMIADYFKMMRP